MLNWKDNKSTDQKLHEVLEIRPIMSLHGSISSRNQARKEGRS